MNTARPSRTASALLVLALASAVSAADGNAEQVARLAEQLRRSPDANVRREAARKLAEFGEAAAPAVPDLLLARFDPELRVVSAADDTMVTLERSGDWMAATVLKALDHADGRVRRRAAEGLPRRPSAEPAAKAAPKLIALLGKDPDASVRAEAAGALGRYWYDAGTRSVAVAALIAATTDRETAVRLKVAASLAIIGGKSPDAFRALVELLKDRDATVRGATAGALSKIPGDFKGSIVALLEASSDPDPEVRACVLRAVGECDRQTLRTHADRVLPLLTQCLTDPRPEIRAAAIRSSASLGEAARPLADALMKAINDESDEVRRATVDALAGLNGKPPGTVAALVALVDHEESRGVRAAAAGAVGGLGEAGKPAIPSLLKLWRDIDGPREPRTSAVHSLSRLAPADAAVAAALMETLRSPSMEDRALSATQLGKIRLRSSAPALITALNDAISEVRLAAVEAIAEVEADPKIAVPALIACVEDVDADVRRAAIRTLGSFREHARPALPALTAALRDERESVRREAKSVLGGLNSLPR